MAKLSADSTRLKFKPAKEEAGAGGWNWPKAERLA